MKFSLAVLFAVFACVYSAAVEPQFNPATDVLMTLFTRNNVLGINLPRDAAQIRNGPFLATRPTRVLVHGWLGDGEKDLLTDGVPALLRAGDFNVIVVDWRAGSTTISYPVAVNRVAAIANFAGGFLDFMQENQLIDYARLHVIGFSLGAHIAGNIGKNVRRGQIDTIIGLDPSGPLFSVQNPGTRIDAADGVYVEILHTNGNSTGIGSPIGDSDFFANGGSNQPGCLSNACHHDRAVDLWVESLTAGNRLFAFRCADLGEATLSPPSCGTQPGFWFAGEPSNRASAQARGIFGFSTGRTSPYGTGPTRPAA